MAGYVHYAVSNATGVGASWVVVRIATSGSGHSVVAQVGTTQEANRIANSLNNLA